MGMLDGFVSLSRPYGRVWPVAKKTKRKRFCAWFERGRSIEVRYFPTRKSAHDWLEAKTRQAIQSDIITGECVI